MNEEIRIQVIDRIVTVQNAGWVGAGRFWAGKKMILGAILEYQFR